MNRLIATALSLLHLIVFGAWMPTAQAALVGMEQALAPSAAAERATIKAFLDRAVVRDQLVMSGVDPAAAQARVDALTTQEARLAAERIGELPAGGDVLGLAVFVFLVLLLTDILGFTDIFPFVKKTVY